MNDLRERNRVLRALDVAGARRFMPGASDEVVLMALHKARYDCIGINREQRITSAEWLRERGLGDMSGRPILPPGTLPR